MDDEQLTGQRDLPAAQPWQPRPGIARAPSETVASFHAQFITLFDAHFPQLYRYLDRLSGEPELASDLAQEAFVKLYGRGSMPDRPTAWLVSVSMNLFRNEKTTRSRRRRLLTITRGEGVHSDPAPSPEHSAVAEETRRRVRTAIDRLPERERRLLLLHSEGYGYRDIATTLGLNEASVGTLLARARSAFRQSFGDPT